MSAEAAVKSGRRRTVEGVVLSNKMQKTVVVQTVTLVKHPKYGKYFKKYKKMKAHDESGQCQIGDRVEMIEGRPLSREKRFRVIKVVGKSKTVGIDLPEQE